MANEAKVKEEATVRVCLWHSQFSQLYGSSNKFAITVRALRRMLITHICDLCSFRIVCHSPPSRHNAAIAQLVVRRVDKSQAVICIVWATLESSLHAIPYVCAQLIVSNDEQYANTEHKKWHYLQLGSAYRYNFTEDLSIFSGKWWSSVKVNISFVSLQLFSLFVCLHALGHAECTSSNLYCMCVFVF